MFFDRIIGQEVAINSFKQILGANRLSHGYIFAGPSGVGKFLFARTLAKILLCEKDTNDWLLKGCDECRSCRLIDKNSHPSLRIIEVEMGKKEISIATVREIEKELMFASFYKSYRVFIFDGAEQMSDEASHCFLKTLEEPARNTIIILITSHLSSLLPTILSRCQIIKFYPLRRDKIKKYLVENGDMKVSTTEANFLTYLCEGSIGDAFRLHSHNFLTQREWLIKRVITRNFDGLTSGIIAFARENSEDNETIRQEIIWQLKIIGLFIRDILWLYYGVSSDKLLNQDKIKETKLCQKGYDYNQIENLIIKLLQAEEHIMLNANMNLAVDNIFTEV
jgi:DNA polymerase-3 subunit delta'